MSSIPGLISTDLIRIIIEHILQVWHALTNGYKVFMPTEFMHAMYDQGGGAGLRDFWDRWMTNPMFAEALSRVFCDEAPKRSDRGGVLDSDG